MTSEKSKHAMQFIYKNFFAIFNSLAFCSYLLILENLNLKSRKLIALKTSNLFFFLFFQIFFKLMVHNIFKGFLDRITSIINRIFKNRLRS